VGGAGSDELLMTTAGTISAGGVSGVETFQLAGGALNTLMLANTNFTGVTNTVITVWGGATGNTVDASTLTSPNRVIIVGGAGADHFKGGAGNDIFKFSAANLTSADTVAGGGGSDTLTMTTAGAINAGGVSGVGAINLAGGAANTLTLANANFSGLGNASITVNGGSAGNTIDASALTVPNRVIAVGGAGTDDFTGGAGNDIFKFSVANLSSADVVGGGLGSDELLMTTAGTVNAIGVSGWRPSRWQVARPTR
jgi:Ca2+-binding RTX toxin-like protein